MISQALQLVAAFVAARYVYRKFTQISLADLQGPPSKSWLAGNIIDLFADSTGMLGARWQSVYGTVMKLNPQIFTENAILVTDPAALHYIFQGEGSASRFIRAPEWYAMADLLAGQCIGAVEGEVHKRHRKGIRPAFGVPETRALLPVFNAIAQKLCEKWEGIIALERGDSAVLNVSEWISKAALDTFGEVAFDYQFGGLDEKPTPLSQAMPTVLLETFGTTSAAQLVLLSILQYVPLSLIRYVLNDAPITGILPGIGYVRNTNKESERILRELIVDRRKMMSEGDKKKDIMGHILRAGLSEDPTSKLTDYEIVSELRFLLLAGQETSANTLTWALWELAKYPEIQTKLREEIAEARSNKAGKDFTTQDLQAMPLLNAVIKETLRFTPVVQNMFRENLVDDVLPLSSPITLKSGRSVKELPIPKGTKIYCNVTGYNMNPALWGEDAHVFNPQRWLNQDNESSNTLGMYANLMTFSAGAKGCIGWRFAVMQLQNLLSELIEKFEFALPEKGPKVVRANCMATQPMIEGQYEKGPQLPLVVRRAA
ncbi:cytochrome P450 [Ephemerocybe angulata]|uniref:Cytochrome P450 n=1 Tax=Ephemerocybe angulata TaxID=980116 RepID=A0A8H6HY31_9AGAR|nr:cytochrome P450 [Tulosesus angulatus]